MNCKMECESNYSIAVCRCVPYYLPKDMTAPICDQTDDSCLDGSRETMDVDAKEKLGGAACDCLPSCFEISYSQSMSTGIISRDSVPSSVVGKGDWNYFLKNMAVIRFFFVESQFKKYTKSELFGFTEFLSNVGGLLGLFLGFSCLSVIEIGYHITIKVLLHKNNSKKEREENPIKKQLTKRTILPYPYYS